MKRFIALSGGVESTTMAILYGRGAKAIWADTGDEEPELYERMQLIEEKLKEMHEGDFEVIRIQTTMKVHGQQMSELEEIAMVYGFPSPTQRWCTLHLKIRPIDRFLKKQGPCELLIGFNADEEPGNDRTGNLMQCKNVNYRYPLYEDGITREDCEGILTMHGMHPNFPIYMQRGGCRKCFYKTKGELKAKYILDRDGFMKDEQFEIAMNKNFNRKKFYAINMNAGTYQSVREEVDREIQLWGIDEVKKMYQKVKSHEPCGAFCLR